MDEQEQETRLSRWTRTTEDISSGIDALWAAVESIAVSTVSRLTTWAALSPSAIMVSRSAGATLDLAPVWALCIALAVEATGVTISSQWLIAREHNEALRAALRGNEKRIRQPLANATMMFLLLIGYFAVAESLIVTFEYVNYLKTGTWYGFTAVLFPGLSFVSMMAMNERIIHRHRVAKSSHGSHGVTRESLESHTRSLDGHIVGAMLRVYRENPYARNTEVAGMIGTHPNTVGTYRRELEGRGVIKVNGKGVEVV